jgi:osmotically-inducible protein OsmY
LWVDPDSLFVAVTDGVVTVQGKLERQSEVEIAGHLMRTLPGVVDVHNQLRAGWDDTTHTRQTEIFG